MPSKRKDRFHGRPAAHAAAPRHKVMTTEKITGAMKK